MTNSNILPSVSPALNTSVASQRNGTLYIGVTSNLVQRIWQHRNDLVEGFTEKYGVHGLVYVELLDDMLSAITREKQLKK